MHVLILSEYWSPTYGVPQRRWHWLTGILEAAGHTVSVVTPRTKSGPIPVAHETLVPTQIQEQKSGLTERALAQIMSSKRMAATAIDYIRGLDAAERPAVIIGTVPTLPTAKATEIVGKKTGIPNIIDLRDAWPDLLKYTAQWNEETGRQSLREKLLGGLPTTVASTVFKMNFARTLANAAGIISTTTSLEAALRQDLYQPFFSTVRNVFPPPTHPEVRHTHTPGQPLHVLYAGTIGRAQKLSHVLDAVALLPEGTVDVRFVGTGAAQEYLRSRVEYSPVLRQAVSFYPRTINGRLSRHYEWADVGLVHLADWEPLRRTVPSKMYELMEEAIPVVGVVEGEAQHLIENLGAGWVAAPGDVPGLAALFSQLAAGPVEPVGDAAREWVLSQREQTAPDNFLWVVESAAAGVSGGRGSRECQTRSSSPGTRTRVATE
ncbi:MAG: glycosyltransferase family 4 protein [Corynebacterium sp.]|nr:glycosyltransferase family 4 protein [Corynebacterium sp.]